MFQIVFIAENKKQNLILCVKDYTKIKKVIYKDKIDIRVQGALPEQKRT